MRYGYSIESLTLSRTTDHHFPGSRNTPSRTVAVLRAQRNLTDLGAICAFNWRNDLGLFCMAGETLPERATRVLETPAGAQLQTLLPLIAEVVQWSRQRLFVRPFHHPALEASIPSLARQAIADVERCSALLDRLGATSESKVLIPIGGYLPEPRAAEERLRLAIDRLSACARRRLALHNSGPCLSSDHLLRLSDCTGAPLVLHYPHDLRAGIPSHVPDIETAWRFFGSWQPGDGVPLVVFGDAETTGEDGLEPRRTRIAADGLAEFLEEVCSKLPCDLLYTGAKRDLGLAVVLDRLGVPS